MGAPVVHSHVVRDQSSTACLRNESRGRRVPTVMVAVLDLLVSNRMRAFPTAWGPGLGHRSGEPKGREVSEMETNKRARGFGPLRSLSNRESIARAARYAASLLARAVLVVAVRVIVDRLMR